ncbi:MAG: murein biosynthesis integral membrane protein MurJ, partial [Nitrospinaceae bacterium]
IIFLFAPGFLDNPEQFDLAVTLTRWMAPFLLGIGLAAFFNGLLNTMQVFALPAAAPVLLNLSMIGAALWLSPRMETPILGLAAGVILGGALQFIFVLPAARRRGFRFSRVWNWRDPGLTRMFRLMGPAVLGLAVYEVNLLVDTLLASLLPGGSISYLYYANRLVQLPLGVFGVALGVVLLPNLAGQAAKQDWVGLRETLAFGIRFVLFITIPATVGLILLREPIIHTLWERGEFTPAVTDGTAVGLLYYTVGLCAFAGSKVLTSAFYSMQDTKTPVKVGIWAMGLNIVLNLALMGPMLHGGLALATSLAAMFNAAVLLHLLRQRLGLLGGRQILRTTLKVAAAAVLMGLLVYGFNLAFFDRAAGTVYKAFILMLSIALGGMSFGVLTHWMKIEELRHFLDLKKGKPGSGIPVNGNGD